MKHTPLSYIFTLVEQYFISLKLYIESMNDELSDDIKKKFILPLTIDHELQDHEEKVFHNAPVFPTRNLQFEPNIGFMKLQMEIGYLKFSKIVPR